METVKRFRLWALIVSCCLIALGALMVIWPGISALVVCIILGILCVAAGVCELCRYSELGLAGIFFRFDLALGILSIVAGILLLLHPDGAAAILPVAAGLYIIVDSVFGIQISTEMRRLGDRNSWLTTLLGILGALLGVLLIIDPFDGVLTLMVFAGVSLIISGVESLITISRISRAVKNGRGGVIDAEWKIID